MSNKGTSGFLHSKKLTCANNSFSEKKDGYSFRSEGRRQKTMRSDEVWEVKIFLLPIVFVHYNIFGFLGIY